MRLVELAPIVSWLLLILGWIVVGLATQRRTYSSQKAEVLSKIQEEIWSCSEMAQKDVLEGNSDDPFRILRWTKKIGLRLSLLEKKRILKDEKWKKLFTRFRSEISSEPFPVENSWTTSDRKNRANLIASACNEVWIELEDKRIEALKAALDPYLAFRRKWEG